MASTSHGRLQQALLPPRAIASTGWAMAKGGSLDMGWETLTLNTGNADTTYKDTGDNDGTVVPPFHLDLVDFTYRGQGDLRRWHVWPMVR